MKAPLVSVCLPNLNTLPYLPERVDTIFGQTLRDWELVISDNYSDDGAWEFFQSLARKDPRVSIAQAPKEGMYANWNQCVKRARGEFVYIATSDDGMAPDCLEKLAAALARHKDCDVAHCPLIVVDEIGAPLPKHRAMDSALFERSAPELVNRPHVRRAPFDGLLCLLREHVYYSITETLIRRSLFSRIGSFESRWGSVSDFQWHMRVGLVASTVHVPDTWATWRIHPLQATAFSTVNKAEYDAKIEDMIRDAVQKSETHLAPAVLAGLRSHWLEWTREMMAYYGDLFARRSVRDRRLYQMSRLFNGGTAARHEVIRRVCGKPKWPDIAPLAMQRWLVSLGIGPVLVSEVGENIDPDGRQGSQESPEVSPEAIG
jgi:glycosyltransferase involved in cell wall biosynthesis